MRDESNIGWEGYLSLTVVAALLLMFFAPIPTGLARLLAGYSALWGVA